jgi:hypothetical protein
MWDFEEAAFAQTPCNIHAFDCTVGHDARPPAAIKSRTTLHRSCLAKSGKGSAHSSSSSSSPPSIDDLTYQVTPESIGFDLSFTSGGKNDAIFNFTTLQGLNILAHTPEVTSCMYGLGHRDASNPDPLSLLPTLPLLFSSPSSLFHLHCMFKGATYFKLDIEGYEWGILRGMVRWASAHAVKGDKANARPHTSARDTDLPKQIFGEFHLDRDVSVHNKYSQVGADKVSFNAPGLISSPTY